MGSRHNEGKENDQHRRKTEHREIRAEALRLPEGWGRVPRWPSDCPAGRRDGLGQDRAGFGCSP